MVIRNDASRRPGATESPAGGDGESCAGDAFFGHSPGRIDHESRWTRRTYDELHQILRRLPVHWRFYAKHKIFESVEAAGAEGEAASEELVRQAYARLLAEQPQLKTEVGLE